MDQHYYDTEYPKTNRDRSMTPVRIMAWCHGCDTQLVEYGRKCPKCGCRNGNKKRLKK